MKTHRNVYQNIVFLVYIHRWSGQSWVCYSFILLSYCFFLLFCHKKSCRCFLVELISHFVMLTPFITFYTIWGCSWERSYNIIVVHIHFRWFLVNSCLIGNLFFFKTLCTRCPLANSWTHSLYHCLEPSVKLGATDLSIDSIVLHVSYIGWIESADGYFLPRVNCFLFDIFSLKSILHNFIRSLDIVFMDTNIDFCIIELKRNNILLL